MRIRSITAPNPGPFTLDGTRTWLLGETAVIDPGPAIATHVAAIREAMPRLATILITHRHADHAPAAIPLKEMSGARIVAPLGVLPEQLDLAVADGDEVAIEGEPLAVIATPGHTQEHVCYLTRDGDLFTGDTILGRGTTAVFPPDGQMADYIRSLQKLRAANPRRILPAHGPDRADAVQLIDEYIAHRLERERQVVSALASGASTIDDLRAVIYPELAEGLNGAAASQIAAHLVKLEGEHRVERSGSSFRLTDEP